MLTVGAVTGDFRMGAEKYTRMRVIRIRRPALQDIEITVPDPRSPAVRHQIAEEVARLDREDEEEAMAWIEAVSEFDNDVSDGGV